MKNYSFVFLMVLILCCNSLSAQYKSVLFGASGSAGLSWCAPQSARINGTKVGASTSWGFFCNYYFVENYSLSIGFAANNLRFGYTFSDNMPISDSISVPVSVDVRANVGYIQIPFLMKFNTEEFGDWRFGAHIGYGLGFRSSVSYSDNITPPCEIPYYTSYESYYRKVMSSLIIGAGAEYSIRFSTSVAFGINYQAGSSIVKQGGGAKVNSLNIYATFKF